MKKVLAISPDYSWAYFNLASIAYKTIISNKQKNIFLKTIEYNKQDTEAYKLLTKICIKENEIEEIISLLESTLDNEDNGDLFYALAQVYKLTGDLEAYAENLDSALDSPTLTYSRDIVKQEFDAITYKLEQEK